MQDAIPSQKYGFIRKAQLQKNTNFKIESLNKNLGNQLKSTNKEQSSQKSSEISKEMITGGVASSVQSVQRHLCLSFLDIVVYANRMIHHTEPYLEHSTNSTRD